MATNPAVSLPDADAARAALGQLDLLVVSENVVSTDSISRGAHVLLPACAWGEKDGTVTNSERRISRQRAFLPAPGEAKPDWWMVSEVARRMGFADAFPYSSPAEIFAEHAALSAFENDGSRDFDIGGLAALSAEDYDTLAPVQWPLAEGDAAGRARFFAEGGFYTADRRARFVVPERPALAEAVSERFPYLLNTGRARDQWHTMTRTGSSPRLGSHRPVPYVELHPDDAARLGLATGDLARVETAHGSAVLEVIICDGQRPGSLFAPIHWSHETSSDGRVGALVHATRRSLFGSARRQGDAGRHHAGAAVAARLRALPRPGGLAEREPGGRARPSSGGTATLFATEAPAADVAAWTALLFPDTDVIEYADSADGIYRGAAFRNADLVGCVFVGPAAARPQFEAVRTLLRDAGGGAISTAAS